MSSPKIDRQIELTLCSLLRVARRSLRTAERLEASGVPSEIAWEAPQARFALISSFMETAGKFHERTKHLAAPAPMAQPADASPRVKEILGVAVPHVDPVPVPDPEPEPPPPPPVEPAPTPPVPDPVDPPEEPPPPPRGFVGIVTERIK